MVFVFLFLIYFTYCENLLLPKCSFDLHIPGPRQFHSSILSWLLGMNKILNKPDTLMDRGVPAPPWRLSEAEACVWCRHKSGFC